MSEKIDIVDFIINVLRQHEKELSENVTRLEDSINILKENVKRIGKVGKIKEEEIPVKPSTVLIVFNWSDFKDLAREAESLFFRVEDGIFHVEALKESKFYAYQEALFEALMEFKEEDGKFIVERTVLNNIDNFQSFFEGGLRCGLHTPLDVSMIPLPENKRWTAKIGLQVSPNAVKGWLSKELGVTRRNIFQGKMKAI